ncbi:hypothetical protein [Priestia megaterium]|uniref:hypothetical protein n=1 Tax=Priestia megaterium TaxID=1404 RepID=UPI00046F66FD|nr:hypothetical protein [Priestia megaterium]PFA94241.1 hypothetical protein CN383_26710 [Priestia megaterium]TCN02967.1 hypothetical protein EV581_1282 [Bacillus sp. BK006]
MIKKIISTFVATLCGSLMFEARSFDPQYEQITFNSVLGSLVFGVIYILPIVIVFGIPSSIMIDTIIKNLKTKYRHLIELSLYIVFGAIGTAIILLILALGDGISVLTEFGSFFILSLSCSVPFGISSIILNYVFKTVPSH